MAPSARPSRNELDMEEEDDDDYYGIQRGDRKVGQARAGEMSDHKQGTAVLSAPAARDIAVTRLF